MDNNNDEKHPYNAESPFGYVYFVLRDLRERIKLLEEKYHSVHDTDMVLQAKFEQESAEIKSELNLLKQLVDNIEQRLDIKEDTEAERKKALRRRWWSFFEKFLFILLGFVLTLISKVHERLL